MLRMIPHTRIPHRGRTDRTRIQVPRTVYMRMVASPRVTQVDDYTQKTGICGPPYFCLCLLQLVCEKESALPVPRLS